MKYPILEPHPDGYYTLYEDYSIKGYNIPKGFKTDGEMVQRYCSI